MIVALAGCAAAPQTTTPEAAPTSDIVAPSSAAPPTPAPAPETPPPIDTILPVTLGGVELHTFAVGQDILERLAARLAVGIDRFEVRYASEHGARFLQMYALRLPGTTGAQLVEAWVAAVYPPDIDDAASSEESLAGKTVTLVSAASVAERLGAFHIYNHGDTLIAVQAFDPQVAAEALAALP